MVYRTNHLGVIVDLPTHYSSLHVSLAYAHCLLFLRSSRVTVFLFCFIACASHVLLDAMTNGGLGVAIAWPFNQHRYFLPFRPIEVSPVSISGFFSEWGLRVIYSEFLWVFLPAASVALAKIITKHRKKQQQKHLLLARTHNDSSKVC